MRWIMAMFVLVVGAYLLCGCATVDVPARDPMQEDATQLRIYGVAEAYVMRGPELKRTAEGFVTCESPDKLDPCEIYAAGGWEPFADAIASVTHPVAAVITTGAALLLGRDEIPEAPIADATVSFEGEATVEPASRYPE